MRTLVHAKLCIHKAVTVYANLHGLIYNVPINIVSLHIWPKDIIQRYAQHKGFSCFN